MAPTSRRGPDTGTESDLPPEEQAEPTSDVLRTEQAAEEPAADPEAEWPANRADGNPFNYGGRKPEGE